MIFSSDYSLNPENIRGIRVFFSATDLSKVGSSPTLGQVDDVTKLFKVLSSSMGVDSLKNGFWPMSILKDHGYV